MNSSLDHTGDNSCYNEQYYSTLIELDAMAKIQTGVVGQDNQLDGWNLILNVKEAAIEAHREVEMFNVYKNLPIAGKIFYFSENYIFLCSSRQTIQNIDHVESKPVCHLHSYIDLKHKLFVLRHLNQKTQFLKEFLVLKNYLLSHKEKFLYYLNNSNARQKVFYHERCMHFGHTILDILSGVDTTKEICEGHALICEPFTVLSSAQLLRIFKEVIFIPLESNEKQQNNLITHVLDKNLFLLKIHPKHKFTYNFINELKSQSSDNLKSVMLVAKHDNKAPINQTELFKHLIEFFGELYHIKKFLILDYFKLIQYPHHRDVPCHHALFLKNIEFFKNKNMELIKELESVAKKWNAHIDNLFDLSIETLVDTPYNLLCYVSPTGSLQHTAYFLTNCHNGFGLGNSPHAVTQLPFDFFYAPPAAESNMFNVNISDVLNVISKKLPRTGDKYPYD